MGARVFIAGEPSQNGTPGVPAPDIVSNAAWEGEPPILSVLIACHGRDPTRLIAALDGAGAAVEIIVLDDGADERLAWTISASVRALARPARFIRLAPGQGRARSRNRLAAAGRGESLLFLDADLLPDDEDFLERWLALVAREHPAVAFGGFTLEQAPATRIFAVHRALARRSDCLPAKVRRRSPRKHVFTSNLLIRRDVFDAHPFDPGFIGWGWEDIEWSMRVSRTHPIRHVDIAVTRLRLDPAEVVAATFEQSAANFARVARRHPDMASACPGYGAARTMRRLPLLRLWRPWLKAVALMQAAPAPPRALALRLYRAALYAEALG
jgi:glycosyltransferase involved in cell wall biosynthesis